jgi:UDP:flavonoid glycosyltransferase YjiC (YdhE family)
MDNCSPSAHHEQAVPETNLQRSIIEQAQAADVAQLEASRPTRQEPALHSTDLITPDTTEVEIPPPTYGEIYGEIREGKAGLGTSASVTDDGRVNIRIDGLNRRLSQVFAPALSQHLKSIEASEAPPLPYIPPSLGGDAGTRPPPRLNVVIQVVGSRGDVQPFVALGKVLKDTYGHRVRLATHPTFKSFVEDNDLEFFSIGGDPSQLMAFMVKNPGLMPGFRSMMSGDVGQRRRDVAEYIQGCWRSCYRAGDGMSPPDADVDTTEAAAKPFVADCIIANPPSFAHIHCAEKLGIPLHIMFTMPYSPTQSFPHPLANIQSSNADPQLTNYISYAMIDLLAWQGIGDIVNRFRSRCLGLDPVSSIWGPGMLQRLKIPHTYCWSPALIPKPSDWGSQITISGFYFLNLASGYTPTPGLQAFLDAGPPPVYIGFGSIVLEDPNAMTELIFEAAKKTGQRVLLSKGWGGIGADELEIPDNVFMLGNVPHDWLFQQVSCVVHHGGAGTTAAGITAGRPTVIVPFFGDQPFWGAMIARAGAGPDPIPHKHLTADNLADAINFCLKPESRERAKTLASKIAEEKGSDKGAQLFHQFLEPDRLRCVLVPSRNAVWRVRRTKINLSAFAACTLANANLLDFQDLKLFRAQEHYTDEGPWDPISGGFTAAMGACSGIAMGLVDIPSETWKAVQTPIERNRQQARASLSSNRSEGESSQATADIVPSRSHKSDGTTTIASPQSQGRNGSKDHLETVSNPDSSPVNEPDMMRSRGVHMTKGAGRIIKALIQAPVNISVNLTRGAHNVPKLWGDDTVRPQERVTDFRSGMKAVGREFGFGFYDGVTDLVTQPWKGAKENGATGFAKGIGKGFGGFFSKSTAACLGILSHTMQGVSKEVEKMFKSNVKDYILASRATQGYDEWLQSSEAEKQDVIAQWKLIQKVVQRRGKPDLSAQEAPEAQQTMATDLGEQRRRTGSTPSESEVMDYTTDDYQVLPTDGAFNSSASRVPSYLNTATRPRLPEPTDSSQFVVESSQNIPHVSTMNDRGDAQVTLQEPTYGEHQRSEAIEAEQAQDSLRQRSSTHQAEVHNHESEDLVFERQLKQTIKQSLREHEHRDGHDSQLDLGREGEQETISALAEAPTQPSNNSSAEASRSRDSRRPPSYDHAHLEGTTQSAFEAQQQAQQGEKTTQERTEEEIVLEYIKKQSLLEVHHQSKGKGRVVVADDKNDEDLQRALKLSLQDNIQGDTETSRA